MKIIIVGILGVGLVLSFWVRRGAEPAPATETPPPVAALPATTQGVTLTGTYVCLPTKSGEPSPDCAFGIKTESGEYYAVNFGAQAGSMADFQNGATITATGTLIPRADLRPDSWVPFEMNGLFTILEK